ncbi:MAG: hypothetical protein LBC96_01285 [Lachnospiraceae bacterium]|jgi:hypothetical protein|nr:hypothetical protein [Lachnospiraceae bacterium]
MKMQLKKTFISTIGGVIMMVVLVLTLPTYSYAAEIPITQNLLVTDKEDTPSNRIIHSYDKTIVVYFPSYSSVPSTYYYEEFNYGSWFKGTLNLRSVVVEGSWFKATYSGKLVGNI